MSRSTSSSTQRPGCAGPPRPLPAAGAGDGLQSIHRRRLLLAALAAGALPAATLADEAAAPARLGFALGSGALHGYAHIGLVRACARLGIVPYAIAGTSVGAAVGALWAAGLDAAAILRVARQLDWSPTASALLRRLLRGQRHNDALVSAIEHATGGRRIEQLPIRFAAAASDLLDGDAVVLSSGPVAQAVAASSAVPVWFEPVRIDGRELVDGSLTAPVPVAAARLLGAQRVVAVDVAYRPYEEKPSSWFDRLLQPLHIATNALAREQTRSADFLLKLDLHHLMLDHFDPDALIDAGERAMLALAPALRAAPPAPLTAPAPR